MIHFVADSIATAAAAWVICVAAFGLFILGSWVAWTSPKFKRKWQWSWLAFVSFPGFVIELPPHSLISGAFPVGALYVLWRWKFGASTPEEQQAEAAARPKSIVEMLRSRAGYGAAVVTAFFLAALGGPFRPVGAAMVAGSIGLFWMANRYRGRWLARPRAALIASLSWCALVGLIAVLIVLDPSGPPIFALRAGIFVVLWPLIFCTMALIQNSWSVPRPDPEPAPAT